MPALARGAVVITDRYIDSSIAYQGFGRGLDIEEVIRISRWATGGLLPHLTLVLDLLAEDGLRRARGRSGRADRLEAEAIDFHERVRAGFLQLAKADPERYAVIDATGRTRCRWPQPCRRPSSRLLRCQLEEQA